MADPSKTESATPKRRREARERGQIARSQEVNTFLIMLLFLITLRFFARTLLDELLAFSTHYLGHLSHFQWTPELLESNVLFFMYNLIRFVFPFFIAAAIGGLVAGIAQAGFSFSLKPIAPKFSAINPIQGVQRIFSMYGLINLLKAVVKIVVVGWVSYATVRKRFPGLMLLSDMPLKQGLLLLSDVIYQLLFRIIVIMAVLAVLDFLVQKRQFEENLKMTKQEVKEELKQMEGSPQTRSRIRAKQRQMAMRRMMAEVPKAVVVVTNPTHLAIALQYEEALAAPRVVAKGAGFIAERIREIAREHKIPILEKPPLAQAIFKSVEIGRFIPPNMYHAVAEIIAYVYQLKASARNIASSEGGR